MADLLFIRILFVLILSCSAFFMRPLQLEGPFAAAVGGFSAILLILLEIRCRRIPLPRLIGAVSGGLTSILGAFILSLVLGHALPANQSTIPFLQVSILICAAYFGIAVGSAKGDLLNLSAMGGLFGSEKSAESSFKILDTSVIIDGRIVDVAETGFIEGTLVIPQFVLRELQMVADSADSMKRNRGRRGLDILQRIQKMPNLTVRITEEDFPQVREVDLKLIELAKVYACTIVTNDFNLNKVAQVRGVQVLNLNELANALKPVVLPGESMRVFILKEGKEYSQGIAYLDDGTMVVVDNARRMISKTIDITVTSVLQTTAGKMIFGRFDERTVHAPQAQERQSQPAPERTERAAIAPPAH